MVPQSEPYGHKLSVAILALSLSVLKGQKLVHKRDIVFTRKCVACPLDNFHLEQTKFYRLRYNVKSIIWTCPYHGLPAPCRLCMGKSGIQSNFLFISWKISCIIVSSRMALTISLGIAMYPFTLSII